VSAVSSIFDLPYVRAARLLKAENAKWPDTLTSVPRDRWECCDFGATPDTVFRSSTFLAQVFNSSDGSIRVSINRTELVPGGQWRGGITWDELQELKRQVGYGDRIAVEIYPRDRDLVNVANMRHLWVMPEDFQLGWRAL
jgi:hypothetical protein